MLVACAPKETKRMVAFFHSFFSFLVFSHSWFFLTFMGMGCAATTRQSFIRIMQPEASYQAVSFRFQTSATHESMELRETRLRRLKSALKKRKWVIVCIRPASNPEGTPDLIKQLDALVSQEQSDEIWQDFDRQNGACIRDSSKIYQIFVTVR